MKKLALLVFLLLCAAASARAADLIDINTAGEGALETLPGIGTTKAEAIIAYREAHGPFAQISDIEDVSGIGPATYAGIKELITVEGGAGGEVEEDSSSSGEGSQGGASTSTPERKELPVYVDGGGGRTLAAGADSAYTANVYDASGRAYEDPQVRWSFGDGTSAIGASVMKSYALPGTYLVYVSAVAAGSSGEDSFIVTAKAPAVRVAAVSAAGITLENADASAALDLSRWQLSAGAGLFTFPEGTKLAPGASVVFTPAVTALPADSDAALLYPSGAVAATYAPERSQDVILGAPPVQPPAPAARSYQVQEAAPASSPSTSPDADYDEAVIAPAATSELAAAGAPLPPGGIAAAPAGSRVSRGVSGVLRLAKSPWTLGALGILAFSAAAFRVL
jgi:competence ComEA-like helix-hairpin-helix protein